MTALRPELRQFLETLFPEGAVRPISGDASARRFYRIETPDGKTRVLMDYGKPFSGETDDMALNRIFKDAGLRVAEILKPAGSVGGLLLEDLGDRTLESVLDGTRGSPDGSPINLVQRAVRLAADIADRGSPVLAASERSRGPALDSERFRFEMDFFLEHYAVGFRGCLRRPAGLEPALHALADRAAETPRSVLCHRDFHSRNIMVLDDGDLAMVDIQDARWGPDSYDLASLLRDAYTQIDANRVDPLIQEYLAALRDPPDAAAFRRRFDRVAAQRMIKALGSFGYLTVHRDGRRYRDAIPRTLARLRVLLPALPETREVHTLLARAGLLDDPESGPVS